MRLRYSRRREALLAALAAALPDWRPTAATGGLHLLVSLPHRIDEPTLLASAARHGVGIEGLSLHSYTGDCEPGLVLGYAHMAEPAIDRGVQLLRDAALETR
jgi:GntR family transcriptional regulator/MocR family aminotransferase